MNDTNTITDHPKTWLKAVKDAIPHSNESLDAEMSGVELAFRRIEEFIEDKQPSIDAAMISAQNDMFRIGLTNTKLGKIVATAEVANGPAEFLEKCIKSVREFDEFTYHNDPLGHHDMGFFCVDDQQMCWRIDLFDTDFKGGSENPTDIKITRRVLTIAHRHDM